MKKTINSFLILSTLVFSAYSQAQVVTRPCMGSACYPNTSPTPPHYTSSGPQRLLIEVHSGKYLNQMLHLIQSIEGRVDYYTYGEVFIPIRNEIGTLRTVTAVYGGSHQQTLQATIKLLQLIDKSWPVIENFKNTEAFFETINYFELTILRLKRETIL
jgi:hypothetical protein